MTILVLHGPNLNMLGKRDPAQYGTLTLAQINDQLIKQSGAENIMLSFFQSNHEGALIDKIQESYGKVEGILINPGGLTHTSISLRDALIDSNVPVVEVHLSDTGSREEFRKVSYISDIAVTTITGHKEQSYSIGLNKLISHLRSRPSK